MEFCELVTRIKEFNKCDGDHYNDILNNTNNIRHNENKKQLNEFNWKMRVKNYREKIHNEKIGRSKKPTKVINSINDIQAIMEKKNKNKKWGRLDLYTKKEKVREYIQTLYNNNLISDTETEIDFLFNELRNKKINKKSDLVYDSSLEKILSIKLLNQKYNKDFTIKND